MNIDSEPDRQRDEGRDSTGIGWLSESAIRGQVLSDAVQHPATLLPLAVSGASAIYLLVLSPVFGAGLWAIVLLTISGVVAAVSFAWRRVFRYTGEYAMKARELMDLQDRLLARQRQAEMTRLRQSLETELEQIDSTEGLRVLTGLVGEFDRLRLALGRQDGAQLLSLSHLSGLATEVYGRGLGVLSHALELMTLVRSPGREGLVRQIAELEAEVGASKVDEKQAERRGIRESRLASHRQRLDMLDQLQLGVDRLLFQADKCEASLHRARIEVAAIRTGTSEWGVDSVIEALRRTIGQVKEVQEDLKKLGY